MSAKDSYANVIGDLFAVLQTGGQLAVTGMTLAGPVMVYDHEPPQAQGALYVTLTLAGLDPEFFHIAVRVYGAPPGSLRGAQFDHAAVIMAVDRLLPSAYGGPVSWQVGYDDSIGRIVGLAVVDVGREDLF